MGKNINQLTTSAGSVLPTDKLYLGRSPFGATDDRYLLGSDLISQFSAGTSTVGTGGTYATFAAAFTAGAFNLVQISNVTETADFTFNSGTTINISITNPLRYTTTFGQYSCFQITNNTTLNININGLVPNYAFTVDKSLITCLDAGSSASVNLYNVTSTNASNIGLTYSYLIDKGAGSISAVMFNCIFNLNNAVKCGLNLTGSGMQVCQFYGGGAACSEAFASQFATGATNFIIQGTFSPVNTASPHFAFTNAFMAGISCFAAGDVLISVTDCSISNITNPLGIGYYFLINSTQTFFTNCDLNTGGFILQDGSYLSATNCSFYSIDESLLTTRAFVKISNSDILNNLTIASTSIYQFDNCNFKLNLAITSDNARISNCTIGLPGGVQTLTVNAAADKTTLIGNASNVAIVNNGTNTELFGNTTF